VPLGNNPAKSLSRVLEDVSVGTPDVSEARCRIYTIRLSELIRLLE
jgi:hypothetical protein